MYWIKAPGEPLSRLEAVALATPRLQRVGADHTGVQGRRPSLGAAGGVRLRGLRSRHCLQFDVTERSRSANAPVPASTGRETVRRPGAGGRTPGGGLPCDVVRNLFSKENLEKASLKGHFCRAGLALIPTPDLLVALASWVPWAVSVMLASRAGTPRLGDRGEGTLALEDSLWHPRGPVGQHLEASSPRTSLQGQAGTEQGPGAHFGPPRREPGAGELRAEAHLLHPGPLATPPHCGVQVTSPAQRGPRA